MPKFTFRLTALMATSLIPSPLEGEGGAALAAEGEGTAAPAAADAVAPSPNPLPQGERAIGAEADAILAAAYPADGPGAAAIVTRHGQPVYTGARGISATGQPLTAQSVFGLGSITKQFTAALVLQLAAEGKLSLDDPLGKFFPDWPQPGATATVRQLLNHTSGIQDFSKVPGWINQNRDRDVTTQELLAITQKLGSKAAPGESWEYNNGGYIILGAIVEKVTQRPWFEAIETRIAKPLGLASLRGTSAESGGSKLLTAASAAGGLEATVGDLGKWADALHHGKVVTPALYAEMTAPAKLTGGKTAPYGFALRLRYLRGHKVFEHGGAGQGIDADSGYLPDDDVFVAVLGNSNQLQTDTSVTLRRLGALAIGAPLPMFSPATVDAQAVAPLIGEYSGEGRKVRFFERDGTWIIGAGPDEMKLVAAGDGKFYSASTGLAWIEFSRDANGGVVADLYDPQDAKPERYVRVGDIPADAEVRVPAEVLQSYTGDYQTETLAVTVSLTDKGKLVMAPKGQEPIGLRPISQTEFMTDDGRMKVAFFADGGAVNRFTMYRGARELHGTRIGK